MCSMAALFSPPDSLLSSSSSVTFYSPLSNVPEKRRGAVSALPLLPPLSLPTLYYPSSSLGVPVNAPGAMDASQHQAPALSPFQD